MLLRSNCRDLFSDSSSPAAFVHRRTAEISVVVHVMTEHNVFTRTALKYDVIDFEVEDDYLIVTAKQVSPKLWFKTVLFHSIYNVRAFM